MEPNSTPTGPTRKTVVTGESAPELTDSFRPIPLGIDRQGDPSGQIRAFAVAVRNRSDNTVYVKESDESDPVPIERFESYNIWETNGISSVLLKGAQGGETVELRLLVAHNEFDVRDKIDAFVRAINHFLTQNKQETVITDSETTFNVDGNVTVDEITSGTVDIGNVNDSIDIASGTVDIGQITDGIDINSGTVSIDDITGQTTTLDVAGSVTVDDIVNGTVDIGDGNVTVDDITAASANFDGDITGQSDFDLSVFSREGREYRATLSDSTDLIDEPSSFTFEPDFAYWEFVSNAANDGFIRQIWHRFADPNGDGIQDFGAVLQINDGSGWEAVTPKHLATVKMVQQNMTDSSIGSVETYDRDYEAAYTVNPRPGLKFQQGDSLRFRYGPSFDTPSNTNPITVESSLRYTLIENDTQT